MTKEKWIKIYNEECNKHMQRTLGNKYADPANWPDVKASLLSHIEEMDKAFEVYNLENGVKNGN
jgi:hypothetical protein